MRVTPAAPDLPAVAVILAYFVCSDGASNWLVGPAGLACRWRCSPRACAPPACIQPSANSPPCLLTVPSSPPRPSALQLGLQLVATYCLIGAVFLLEREPAPTPSGGDSGKQPYAPLLQGLL